MSTESRLGGSGLLSSGWLAAVLLAAGAFALREPVLQSTRPAANEPRIEQRFAAQDVDARLWQDPLGAVMRAREERVRKLGRAEQQTLERKQQGLTAFQQEIAARLSVGEPAGRIIVLAAMVSGGPYAESVESRRRMRYAVLAALNAADYAPADTEHLGYFLPHNQPPLTLPEAVPYEWFKPLPGRQPVAHPVLVLWLDNGPFYEKPFDTWRDLLRQLEPDASITRPSRLLWRVLGPMGSDGLHAMIRHSEDKHFQANHFEGWDLRFYSLAATVSDAKLLEDTWRARNESLSDYFRRKGITLLRTIGDDKSLAASLVTELGLRGLKTRASPEPGGNGEARQERYRKMCHVRAQRADSPHQIAIVAEWDTLYGRSLRREFRIAEDDDKGFCVNRFHYVRGLDGLMPEHGSAPAPTGAGAKDAGPAKDSERRSDGSFIERAEGQSQYDYLRRLAARLRERDRELRASSVDGAGLRAIGVLGNDVHDKLLVLQALRPEFPNALFFTTDLDARFLHPREQPWTRNLIVASNFGLRLTDGLQAGTPPFRDNYQTSAFFSTRLALDDQAAAGRFSPQQLVRWLGQPRIFEIGRSMAFDFSAPAQAGDDERRACRSSQLAACADIHPPGTPRYPHISPLVLSLLAGVLVLLVWLPPLALNRSLQRRLRRSATHHGGPWPAWLRQVALALLLMLLQLVLPVVLAHQWPGFADWLTRGGKPISFSEGISLWPTEAIHLLTLLLCLYLVFRGWTALTRNLDRLSLTLHLGQTRRRLVAEQAREDARLSLRCRLAHVFTLRGPIEPDSHPAALRAGRMTAGRLALWRHFIVQNRTSSRFLRSLACTVLVLAVGIALHTGLAEPSGAPQRGPVSSSVHLLLAIAAIVLMNFLVFYVADATLICLRFVRELRPGRANWPDRAIQFFGRQMGIAKPEVVDHWINLQFIAQRTRCVTGLIYYPFIVLSLLLLSRSQFFDNWQMPTVALVMALFDIGVVLLSAIFLRHAAEKARRQALKAVGDWLLQAHAPDAQALPAPRQLELLRDRIQALDEGAFAPFSEQPLLKAVLLPFATLGGSSLLDFLTMANI